MLDNLTVLKMASAMARHAAARHSVLAQNVANADTPGYRARDVAAFAALVKESFTTRATRPGHFADGLPSRAGTPEPVEIAYPDSPNGNSVSLEDQSVRAVEAQGQHAMAMAIYAKSVDLMRMGLGRNR
ncbi:MAG: FlgB family protein [Pseudomonadota bacterium]